jgi:hypothetical protein
MGLVRHRQTKGLATGRPHLNHRVTPRLHSYDSRSGYAVLSNITTGLSEQPLSIKGLP